jgi:hypothetical protein
MPPRHRTMLGPKGRLHHRTEEFHGSGIGSRTYPNLGRNHFLSSQKSGSRLSGAVAQVYLCQKPLPNKIETRVSSSDDSGVVRTRRELRVRSDALQGPRNQPFIENKPVISGLISFVIFPQAQCPTSVRKFIGLPPFALRPLRALGSRTQLAVSAP